MRHPNSNDPSAPWDRLSDADLEGIEFNVTMPPHDEVPEEDLLGWRNRLAAAWGDLVIIIALTTALIGAIFLAGFPLSLLALPWAAAVGFVGWLVGCGILLRVRRGTPGMLLAGCVFANEVSGFRLGRTIAIAGLSAVFLGLPAIPGGRTRSLLSLMSGSSLTSIS
jgi:hypothetical protein